MAVNKLQLKRSAVPGKVPTTSSLDLGELALNTYDGRAFFKQSGSLTSIVELATVNGSGSAVISASYAATASSADNLLVRGTLTAQTIVVQTVSSSVIYSSGSNRFGNDLANTQVFTGSILATGSNHTIYGNVGINTVPTTAFQVGSGTATQFKVASSGRSIYIGPESGNYHMNITDNTIQSTNSGTPNVALYLQPNGTGHVIIGSAGSNNTLIGTSTDAGYKTYIAGSGTSGSLNVNNTLYVSGSRVGVGIINPLYPLDVNGTIRTYGASTAQSIIDAGGTADMASSILFMQNNGNWPSYIGTHTSGGGVNYGLQFKSQNTVNLVMNKDGSNYFGGSFGLGSARVHIRGAGSTSATTALLVQNSNLSASLTVTDDGLVRMGNNAIITGSLTTSGSLTVLGNIIQYNSSSYLGNLAGAGANAATFSVYLGEQAGFNAASSSYSTLIGPFAGMAATRSLFLTALGYSAGISMSDAGNSTAIGPFAGYAAYNAVGSSFLGVYAGASAASSSYSTFIGPYAGWRVSGSSYSTFIGYNTGFNSTLGNNNIIVGTNVTLASGSSNSINIGGLIFGSGSYNNTGSVSSGSANGFIGINQPNPQFNLDISGSARATSDVTVGGNLVVSGSSITLGAGGVQPNFISVGASIYDIAVGGSYITRITRNGYQGFIVANGATIGFSSVSVGGAQMSNSDVAISRVGSNVMALGNGTNGNSSGTLYLGNLISSGSLTVSSASLSYQQNTSVATGSYQTIVSAATGSFRCAFFDYVAFSGSIVRAGTVVTTWSGSATEFYENYTADLGGSTSVVTLQTAISGSNIQLQAGISGSAWAVRSLVRLL